jgi:beta-N-acetylhexosaminidase
MNVPRVEVAFTKIGFRSLLVVLLLSGFHAWAASPSSIHLDRKGEHWARKTLHHMTLEEKVGQMIMVWAKVRFLNVDSPEYLQLRDEMTKYHVGGFGVTVPTEGPLLLKTEPLEVAALTNRLQRDSKFPLIFAADFERGLSMRMNGATAFPAAMAFGAGGDQIWRKNLEKSAPANPGPLAFTGTGFPWLT